jgi:NifB/MoaA-like Fe-S oxidoreductase
MNQRQASGEFEAVIRKPDGEEWIIEIEKEPGEDLGIIFEQPLLDGERSCANKCIFCFIDQLPPNMRDSLYYKDDDWRLSFMMGNYITLTNMSQKDLDRIISKHISPLYISVHTTNPELRQRMLNNKRGGHVLKYLEDLHRAGIELHCQIVLCPGYNDKGELDRTIRDLWAFRSSIRSVAVVPVGLTCHREGLANIEPFDRDSAAEVISQIENYQAEFRLQTQEEYALQTRDELGLNTRIETELQVHAQVREPILPGFSGHKGNAFVYAADEFYILAERHFPDYDSYDGFPQIENGVGLVVRFQQEVLEALEEYGDITPKNQELTIITGESAYKIMLDLAEKIAIKYNITINTVAIYNSFFGGQVSVAGLVTGCDIIDTLKGRDMGDKVLLPQVMLRRGQEVFLDNVTLDELKDALGTKVSVVPVDGEAFVKAVLTKDE